MDFKALFYAPFLWYDQRRVRDAMVLRDYKKARATCERILRFRPHDSFTLWHMGMLADLRHEPAQAETYLRQAVLYQPDFGDARSALGQILQKQGKFGEAIVELNEALKLKLRNPAAAYATRSNARRRSVGDLVGALDDANKAVEANPMFAGGFFERALTRSKMDDKTGALKDYDWTIRLNPKYPSAHYNRANLRRDAGDMQGALDDYNEVLKLTPDNMNALNNRCNVRIHFHDYDGALEDINRVIAAKPDEANAYTNRGKIYSDLRQLDLARADFQKAIALEPDNATVQCNWGANLMEMGGHDDEALIFLNRALELDPNFALAYNNRGSLYSTQDRLDEALTDYNRTIALAPELATAYGNRAILYFTRQQYEQAAADLEKALSLDPRPYILHMVLAYLALNNRALGKGDEARNTWKKLIGLAPEMTDPETIFQKYPRTKEQNRESIRQFWSDMQRSNGLN